MHRVVAKLVVLLLAAGSFFFHVTDAVHLRPAHAAGASCLPRERDALLAFKRGINDTSDFLSSWRQGRQDCCRWTGVTCSKVTGHVHKLELNYLDLVGQISPSLLSLDHLEYLILFNNFPGPNGRVPEFLGSLKNLRHLDLSETRLHGRVPTQLANLSKLEYLDLSGTLLSGRLPPQLANLSKLEYLDLSRTLLSGRLPSQLGNLSNLRHLGLGSMQDMHTSDISWLTRLHFLEYVDMTDINLSTVDVLPVANTIPSLKTLILYNCSLPNANQSLTHLNLTKLEQLDLSSNYFGHPIKTSWFWKLTSIKYLGLLSTYLYGPFPKELGDMTSLQHLDFTSNGNAATMSVDLKNLCDLEVLELDGSLAFGNITELVKKLPQCSSNKLWILGLSDNNMTGMLPDVMGHLTSLSLFHLSNNSITGAIPAGLGNFTSLQVLDLSLNRLTGQIPTLPRSLAMLHISMNCLSGPLPLDFGGPPLIELTLFSNYITGHVPRYICELQSLNVLDLSNNRFVGEFPQCSLMPNMEFLHLSNNHFSGNFPSWLQNCSNLKFLDLAMNKFYGTLPVWIGDLVYLRILQLSHNMFYGDIPVNITNLALLQHLNLAGNNISGSIPWSLSKLIAMTVKHPLRVWPDGYIEDRDVLSMVMKGQELKYGAHAISEMVSIDLSVNQLTGGIPDEIASLTGLLSLNLSWNHLSGKIPEKIGAMKSLESLDISSNKIFGGIPQSLADLTYLSFLNLSYNSLRGRIPQGRQLDTLYTENPSIYDGNIGLCGPPLQMNCSRKNAPKHDNEKKSEKVSEPTLFFYFGLGTGFVAGLWVVFCAFLFKKTWRIAYFRLLDKLYDKVYVSVVVTWGRITSKANTT